MIENSLVNLIPKRNDAILAYRTFEDQVVIVNLIQGTLNLLNATATRIWQLVGERMTPKKIAEKISQEFEAPFGQVLDDTVETLQEMALRDWINDFPFRESGSIQASSDGTEIFEALREQAVQKQIPLVGPHRSYLSMQSTVCPLLSHGRQEAT